MTTYSWIRKLFAPARRTIRKAPRRFRPAFEALEDRVTPTVYLGYEIEENNSANTATPLTGPDVKITGNIFPSGDVDYYSFSAQAGDRVYAAVMTSASASTNSDSVLDLLDTDGTTLLETDDDNGSFSAFSSTIAGATIPATGTYFLRVNQFFATNQLRPYDLWVRVQSGAPTAEIETNDAFPGQALPASGWVSGAIGSTSDIDRYSLNLNAGDSVFLSLDLDPERDGVEWNGQLGFGAVGNPAMDLVANDLGDDGPDSEAIFLTVKDAGIYSVVVSVPPGGTTFGTYHLSVSVLPASTQPSTTYTSVNVPRTIPNGPGVVTSTITIPGDQRIGQLKVAINLTHNLMQDLDVALTSPDGNTVVLFTDVGSTTTGQQTQMNLILDDDAAIPIGSFPVVSGLIFKLEAASRLEWFKGQKAQGTWTLTIWDNKAVDGGTLHGWSLIVVEEPPLPPGTPRTLFRADFEADGGGFTHSGTGDEWEWGTPAFAPITTANSGSKAWKTDLDNTYNANSSQDLFSPDIDLTGVAVGSVLLEWAMKFQLERADFDHAFVEVQEVGGAGRTRKVWEWLGPSMTAQVGNPATTIQEAAGWGRYRALLDDFIGTTIRLRFHVDSDNSVQQAGLAIDDVSVTAFEPAPTDITLDNASVAENEPIGTLVGAFSTSDPDTADIFTYSFAGGADDGLFQIVGNQLLTAASFDFESRSTFSIRVRSTDAGGLSFVKDFTITATNVNETPTEIALDNTSVAENEPPGTLVGALSTTDPDSGDAFTYSFAGGADDDLFQIVGNQLLTAAGFDFEARSTFSIQVRSTDAGGLPFVKDFTITVTDVNEKPTDISLSKNSIAEHQPAGTIVGAFSTTDPDNGDTFAYSLTSGAGDADNASFTIENGQLLSAASFDVLAKSSYSIRVRAIDAGGLSVEKEFTIQVANVNESPSVTVPDAQIAYEDVNKAISGIHVADPDGDKLNVTLAVRRGKLRLRTTTGLTVSGNGTRTVTVAGSIADLNDGLASLVYRGKRNFSGRDTLQVAVGDGALTSAASMAITVRSSARQAAELQARARALIGDLSPVSSWKWAPDRRLVLKGNAGDAARVRRFLTHLRQCRQAGLLTPAQASALLRAGNILLLGVMRR